MVGRLGRRRVDPTLAESQLPGAGIATAFTEAGAQVTITGTRVNADAYDADLSAFEYRPLQLTDSAAIDALAASLPSLDILVNSAFHAGRFEPFDEADIEKWRRPMDVNYFGTLQMTQALLPALSWHLRFSTFMQPCRL